MNYLWWFGKNLDGIMKMAHLVITLGIIRLWSCGQNPLRFVLGGTKWTVYMNGFGPEGGFHLKSCEYIYHPMCLISLMVAYRHRALYKAPFHEHLYDLFGLSPYMLISWECNLENFPGLHHIWGDDLVWSWRLHDHFHNKNNVSFKFRWKNDHEEIVRMY